MSTLIYVVIAHVPYEGSWVQGAFTSKRAAEMRLEGLGRGPDPEYEEYSIETWRGAKREWRS